MNFYYTSDQNHVRVCDETNSKRSLSNVYSLAVYIIQVKHAHSTSSKNYINRVCTPEQGRMLSSLITKLLIRLDLRVNELANVVGDELRIGATAIDTSARQPDKVESVLRLWGALLENAIVADQPRVVDLRF